MTTRRSGLGRGLDALIPVHSEPDRLDFAEVRVDSIKPNPNQPRARFSEEAIASLTESIQAVGILQPVAVMREDDGGYVLIAGERRVRAAKRLGLETIPAVIRTVDNRGSLTEALIENVQREDLSPLEEAAAYQQLLEDFGMTHEEVGAQVGKSRSAITNMIRLLQLPASIQGMLERGELSVGHARALLAIGDRKYAEHIATKAAEEGWSVRQVEEAVRVRKETPPDKPAVLREVRPVEIIELEQRLADRFGTKVSIRYRSKKGRVEIPFKSLEELERLYRLFFV